MKKIKLTIEGMHCASCANNVERAIKNVKRVKNVSISVMTHKGFIECEEDVSNEELRSAVSKAGYKVVKIE